MRQRINELRLKSVPALKLLHEAGHVGDLEPTYKSLMP
jgi:hypothetical protein